MSDSFEGLRAHAGATAERDRHRNRPDEVWVVCRCGHRGPRVEKNREAWNAFYASHPEYVLAYAMTGRLPTSR